MYVLLLEGVVLEEGELGAARLGESCHRVVDAPQVLPLPEVRVGRDQADVQLLLVGGRRFGQAAAAVGETQSRRRLAGQDHEEQRKEQLPPPILDFARIGIGIVLSAGSDPIIMVMVVLEEVLLVLVFILVAAARPFQLHATEQHDCVFGYPLGRRSLVHLELFRCLDGLGLLYPCFLASLLPDILLLLR